MLQKESVRAGMPVLALIAVLSIVWGLIGLAIHLITFAQALALVLGSIGISVMILALSCTAIASLVVTALMAVLLSTQSTQLMDASLLPMIISGLLLAASGFAISGKADRAYALGLPLMMTIGWQWIQQASPENLRQTHQGILLSSALISAVGRPALGLLGVRTGQWNSKGIVWLLLATGILFGLVNNLLLAPTSTGLVWLYGASLLIGTITLAIAPPAESPEPESRSARKTFSILILLFIGLIAVAASRLFGTIGWLVAGSALFAFPFAASASSAALLPWFFVLRVLGQIFVVQSVSNVTGINLLHPYVYAGLLAGACLPIGLQGLLSASCIWRKQLYGALVLGAVPMLSLYGFHAEATGSFMLAMAASTICLSLYQPASTARLAPMIAYVLSVPLWSADLIAWGNDADKWQRALVLSTAIVLLTVLVVLIYKDPAADSQSDEQAGKLTA